MAKIVTTGQDMKCPKCGRYSLQASGEGVICKVCGYKLSPGQVDKFRLFKMLREEERRSR